MRMPWSGDKKSRSPKRRQSIFDVLFTRAGLHWWLLGVICALAVVWVAFPMEEQRRPLNSGDFKVGQKSPRDVLAQFDVTYYDEVATEEEKQRAETEVPPVYILDFLRLENAKHEFNVVRQVRASYILTDEEKVDRMRQLFYIGPSDEVGLILARASDEEIDAMEKEVIRILSDILAGGVMAGKDDSTDVMAGENGYTRSFAEELSRIDYIKPKWGRIREELEEELGQRPTDAQIADRMIVTLIDERSDPAVEKTVSVGKLLFWHEATNAARDMAREMEEPVSTVVREICVDLMRPNLRYAPVLTRERREELLKDFPFVSRTISRGDKIIGVGDIVTEFVKGKLDAVSRAQRRAFMLAVPGALLLVALLACALVIYLKRYEPSIYSEPRKVVALNIAILLVLVLGNLVIIAGPELNIEHPGFLIPTALAPVVVAMLANVQIAILITFITGVFIAMLAGVGVSISLQYFLVTLAGGIAAAISASRARHRRHLMAAGVYVSGVNVVTILGLGLLENISLINLSTNCLIGAVNGFAVAVLTPGLLPIFEYLSRTTTDMELLELADLNQPLLTQLKSKASGSYYHSLEVAKLAETAAEAVDANTLLARVGSYYHDIGKMAQPEHFIENQKGENIHDRLNPSMSARVIANHVKEGVRVAKEHRLPQIIQDIIEQHVGTTMIGGLRFYQKAMEADRYNTVRIEDYRYPGPKPQTKEAAIILLADSVESAARATFRDNHPTYSRLVSFVREIVEGKMMDLQLDECDLTLRDLRSITDAFVRVLSGMYHTRIDYPKEVEALGSASANAGGAKKSEPVGVKSNGAKPLEKA